MLTRIEISGFKSFYGLKLDLHPFTVVAGSNASGKSNLFDALRFLSQLATVEIAEAMRRVRGDPSELFRKQASVRTDAMIFAVEVLLDTDVEDAFGQRRELKHTRLRYELEIERRRDEQGGPERLYVRSEVARPIKRKNDDWYLSLSKSQQLNLKDSAKYSTGGGRSDFLETSDDRFVANQDGVQGRPRPFPILRERATATVLSRITTATEFPHLFALRQELASITFLQLEASAEREPSDALGPDELLPDGSNLAKVLARIEADTRTPERPRGDLIDIRNALAALIPGVIELRIERDDVAGRYRLFVTMRDETEFSSRVLSDGTLRILSLLTFLFDPRRKSVLLFEEPENGVHEERLVRLIEILRLSCSDVGSPIDGRLFQIILNTHSPIVLKSTKSYEIVAADVISAIEPDTNLVSRRTRMRTGVTDAHQLDFEERERSLTRSDVNRLLRQPEDATT